MKAGRNTVSHHHKSDRYRGLCHCGDHAWAVLTKGFVTIVSPQDARHLQGRKWCALVNTTGALVYAGTTEKNKNVLLHRQILGVAVDAVGIEPDHKDHDGLNNRRKNLRPATRSQNCANSRQQSGVSGFRGVGIDRKAGRWIAKISGQHIGAFNTPEEAARAYDSAAGEFFGEFATLNFPEEQSKTPEDLVEDPSSPPLTPSRNSASATVSVGAYTIGFVRRDVVQRR